MVFTQNTTDKGNILVNLEYELTPITVSNFIGLSLGTLSNYSNRKMKVLRQPCFHKLFLTL